MTASRPLPNSPTIPYYFTTSPAGIAPNGVEWLQHEDGADVQPPYRQSKSTAEETMT